jgi:hypothetical protein
MREPYDVLALPSNEMTMSAMAAPFAPLIEPQYSVKRAERR